MISLGCDIGAIATKAVLLDNGTVLGQAIVRNDGRLAEALRQAVQTVLSTTGMSLDAIECRGGTGWGERYIPFPHSTESMIRCLAKGTHWLVPAARTAVDIGGLSTTVIRMGAKGGRVLEYTTNDRCASGTGFFLEMAAQALELAVEDLGPVSLSAKDRAHISAQCAVFGESEIVTHVNDGVDPANIAAGITYSIGASVASMVRRLGVEREVVATGGVAKNVGVLQALEEKLGVEMVRTELDSQIISAVGAALCALERAQD